MLENFIYTKRKALFEKELEAGNVLDEAIVFIDDTKEIWNHGTYFDGNSVDLSNVVTSVKINGSAKSPSLGVVDLGTVITSHQDISGKQDELVSGTNIKTINGESILGNGDVEISNAYAEVNHGTEDTIFTLTPNIFHVWGEISSLDLDLGESVNGIVNEYLFQFTSGETATMLILPDTVKWINDFPDIEPNMTYQCSIINNIGIICGV